MINTSFSLTYGFLMHLRNNTKSGVRTASSLCVELTWGTKLHRPAARLLMLHPESNQLTHLGSGTEPIGLSGQSPLGRASLPIHRRPVARGNGRPCPLLLPKSPPSCETGWKGWRWTLVIPRGENLSQYCWGCCAYSFPSAGVETSETTPFITGL